MAPTATTKRVNPNTRLINQLNELVLEKEHECAALSEERRVLRARAAVAQSAVDHCEALAELAAALPGPTAPAPAASGGNGSGAAAQGPRQAGRGDGSKGSVTGSVTGCNDPGGSDVVATQIAAAAAATAAPPAAGTAAAVAAAAAGAAGASMRQAARDYRDELQRAKGDLLLLRPSGATNGGAAANGGGGGFWGGGGGGAGKAVVPGRAGAAAAAAVAATGSLASSDSAADGAESVGDGVGGGRGVLPQQQGAMAVTWWPDGLQASGGAAAAGREPTLAGFRALVLECLLQFGCLLPRLRTAAPDAAACRRSIAAARGRYLAHSAVLALVAPVLLGEIMLEPLDADAPSPATGLEPPTEHWVYAVKQVELTKEQEEMIFMLMDSREARMEKIVERRAQVRSELRAAMAGSPDARQEAALLREMAGINSIDVVLYMVTNLVLYDSIMEPEQFAAFFVACYPHLPPVEAVGHALSVIKTQREDEQAAAVQTKTGAVQRQSSGVQHSGGDSAGGPGTGAARAAERRGGSGGGVRSRSGSRPRSAAAAAASPPDADASAAGGPLVGGDGSPFGDTAQHAQHAQQQYNAWQQEAGPGPMVKSESFGGLPPLGGGAHYNNGGGQYNSGG